MSGFNNPVVGGGGDLIRAAIRSPNFVTGVSGWSIDKNGSAEFNLVVIRGSLQTGTTGHYILIESGANSNKIQFFSGVPAEIGPGELLVDTSSGTDALMQLHAPDLGSGGVPALTLTSDPVAANNAVLLDAAGGTMSFSAAIMTLATSGLLDLSGGTINLTATTAMNLNGGTGGFSLTGNLVFTGDYIGATRYAIATAVDNTVNNSNVLHNDGALTLSVVPNATYEVEVIATFNTGVNSDLRTAWSVPAGTTGNRFTLDATQTAAAFTSRLNTAMQNGVRAHATVVISQLDAGAVDQGIYERGLVITGANAGSVTFQFCQDVPTVGALSRQPSSYMKITRIA